MKMNAAANETVLDPRVSMELARAQAKIDALKEDIRIERVKAQQVAQIRELKSQLDRLVDGMRAAGTLPGPDPAEQSKQARVFAVQRKIAEFEERQRRNPDLGFWQVDARRERKALDAELHAAMGVSTFWGHLIP